MKKWICFMMTAALCAMALTACGNSSRQQEESGSTEEFLLNFSNTIPVL